MNLSEFPEVSPGFFSARDGRLHPFLSSPLALLLVASFAARQGMPTQTATDLGSLQGDWEGYGPGGECSVTISGNSLFFHAREDFWYETTFTLPAGTDPKQLHATIIKDSSPQQADIGTVVVAIFKIEDETLTLGVVEDFEGPPASPVVGDWNSVRDLYSLERVPPRDNEPTHPPTNT